MLTGRFLLPLLVAPILACGATLSCAQIPRGEDFAALAREARERQAPILIAFVQASCAYCTIAKRDYLEPMQRGAGSRGELIMREVDIDSGATLRNFAGKEVSSTMFAQHYRVTRFPTVVVVDDRGEPVAPPIVGLISDDFYGLYLEQAVAAGQVRMRAPRRQGGVGAESR
jgi:thioredoxin-related protein